MSDPLISTSVDPVDTPLQRFVYVQTMGCQMNVYDTERMLEGLAAHGYLPTDDESRADLILINTCSVRERSEHKVTSMLGTWRRLKEHNPDLVLAVSGCVAQQEGERLLRQVRHLDLVIGPDQIGRLPELVAEVRARGGRHAETDFIDRKTYRFADAAPPADQRVSSFVTVMKGCNKFCSFCIVPTTRGREVSKPADDVISEIEMLASHGVREITLLGQNVNSYGKDRHSHGEVDFTGLLERVCAVDGVERVRFSTSHPMDCTERLIEAFGYLPELMPWFHLPVQSGSLPVLRMMRRTHDVDGYRRQIEHLRRVRPDIAMSTDIIVGFPGETLADHQATLDLLREIRFATIYSFAYSERPGTAAARLGDDVPLAEKKRRLAEVQALQREISESWLLSFEGSEAEVLFEGASSVTEAGGPQSRRIVAQLYSAPQVMGRTPHNIKVNVDTNEPGATRTWPGRLATVRIARAARNSLHGELVAWR